MMYNQIEFQNNSVPPEYECRSINTFNDEIRKNALIIDKIFQLYNNEKVSIKTIPQLTKKYLKILDNWLKLRQAYSSIINDDNRMVEKKFKTVVENIEILQTRREINDISEDEYSIKISATEWDFSHLNDRKNQLKNRLNQIKNMNNILSPEDIPLLTHPDKTNYLLENLEDEIKLIFDNVIKALLHELS